MCSTKENIRKIMAQLNLTPGEVERAMRMSSGSFNKDTKVNADAVGYFLREFPTVSADWLFRGEGDMFRTKSGTSSVTSVTIGGNNSGSVVNNSGVMDSADEITEADFEPVDSIPIIPPAIVRLPNIDVKTYLSDNSETVDYRKVVRGNVIADMCARVKDLAMYPEFQVGDEIYLVEVDKEASLVNGSVYVVDTKSQGLILRMLYDEGDRYKARARACERYTDFPILKSDIIRVFTVTQLRRISY